MKIKIKKMHELARMPEYKTEGAACFDLYSAEDVTIAPGERVAVRLGVAFEIPFGYEMQLRPRSGISFNTGLLFKNTPATIDSDYRGEVKALFFNQGRHHEHIAVGDRVCQGKIAPVEQVEFVVVDELSDTERGDNGFGSTGR